MAGDEILAAKSSSNPIITKFKPIGDAIFGSFTKGRSMRLFPSCNSMTETLEAQAASLLYELELFVQMTGVEQQYQMNERLPTVEEYMERRMGSSAVGVCLAMTEFVNFIVNGDKMLTSDSRSCNGIEIPPSIMQDADVKALWDETNVIIST